LLGTREYLVALLAERFLLDLIAGVFVVLFVFILAEEFLELVLVLVLGDVLFEV